MNTGDIFGRLKAHMLEGMVFHDEMVRYFSFLNLESYAELHKEHYEEETKGYRKLCDYYMCHYNELIPPRDMNRLNVIPDSWYRHKRQDVDTDTKNKAIREACEKWVEWERKTKSLYGDMCKELFINGDVAASMFVSCYVKDVDEELAEAERQHIILG